MSNVEQLQRAGAAKVGIGQFAGAPELQQLNGRANTFLSPYQRSFSEYIKEAVRSELQRAGMLEKDAPVVVEGVLERNALDISGFSIGTLAIEVKFTVRRAEKTTYERSKQVKHEWQSALVGAVAIPLARDQYPIVVRKLLYELYSDRDFIAALKGT